MSTADVAPDSLVDEAVEAAAHCHRDRVLADPACRAAILNGWAQALRDHRDDLVVLVAEESSLRPARIDSELDRTAAQLDLFAAVATEGSWVGARISTGTVDVRRMLHPLGPVAVFSASNFPLAFSTAGGDTASAIAAGCPVVVKAHPAQPRTATAVESVLRGALQELALEGAGIFHQVSGELEIGSHLAAHPLVAAIGFTGSLAGGRALYDLAAARTRPIPVYAEMGSINPIFVIPGMSDDRLAQFVESLAESMTLGVGQFCTQPGAVIGVNTTMLSAGFAHAIGECEGSMLNDDIAQRYVQGAKQRQDSRSTQWLSAAPAPGRAACASVRARDFITNADLHDEVFGPFTLVVDCATTGELIEVAESLDGQLTASIHTGDDSDDALAAQLADALVERVGRLVWNGFPTGVDVSHAMHHGGPYPASTDSRSTSVGSAAIERFARPVAYQNAPQQMLPAELRDSNPTGVRRLVNGSWTRE